MLIISRSTLYYTASGIVTPVGGRPVHRMRESPLHASSTVVLIIRRSTLYYTASGIITLCRWVSGEQVERVLSQPVQLYLMRYCVGCIVLT